MKIKLSGFERHQMTFLNQEKTVYTAGTGPAVVVIHEVPGITPQVIAFAEKLASCAFKVFMPSLLGKPGASISLGNVSAAFTTLCVRREFSILSANKSSPVVDWLRALARKAHEECGGAGVGVVGMCFSGNFGLAMMLDSPVIAPVLSQPSLPIGPLESQQRGLHLSAAERDAVHQKIRDQGSRILDLRFQGDLFCTGKRFEALQQEFGDAFEGIEIAPEFARKGTGTPPHSVLTTHLIDEQGQPTHEALKRTINFLVEHLKPHSK